MKIYLFSSLKMISNVLIFAGTECIFFMVASMILCLGFVQETWKFRNVLAVTEQYLQS